MGRDSKDHPEDLDGWRKNAAKMGGEMDKMADAARKAMDGDSHDKGMDAVTEAFRASPYGASHIVVIGGVIVLAIIVALLVFG